MRSVVVFEEVELRFCAFVRSVLALWLLLEVDEA